MEKLNINSVGSTNINSIDLENIKNPIFLCEVEKSYLLSRGFLVIEILIPIYWFIQSILYQIGFWIALCPYGIFLLYLNYSWQKQIGIWIDSPILYISILPFITVWLFKIAKYIQIYFLSRFVYVSRKVNNSINTYDDAYIISWSTEAKRWKNATSILTGKWWYIGIITQIMWPKFEAGVSIYSIFAILALFIFLPISIPVIISTIVIMMVLGQYNPLYAFGNIWSKIQKLTPEIEKKSKKIQSEFQSDMNFKILRDGFDSLSSTFSEIVSLVLELEKVEKRANKWNLFDSEKYISSLKLDIVWPLHSLRGFLDSKRTELISAQQELSRVRVQVGGTSEQRDLASVRTEPLMWGLTENITQLDVMIEKMG